jgi:uncharacterized protein YndB with AHSA1/START domain
MSADFSDSSRTTEREIVITRLLDAPRALVFDAWTNPRDVAKWWGPNGFTTTIQEMDVRTGGIWRFIMHGPDGVDYKNRIVFIEVAKPDRLVYVHGDDEPGDPGQFHVTVTFTQIGDKTRLSMRMLFSSAEECRKWKEFGAVEGGEQTLARLAGYLPTK